MSVERTVGIAQIILSVVFISGYFGILILLLRGDIHTPPEWKDVLTALVSILTAGVLTIVNFWFNRGRPQDTPRTAP